MLKKEWLALDRAVFLPAIGPSYMAYAEWPAFKYPSGNIQPSDLNYLDPAAPFHYPFTLFSAGQVQHKSATAVPRSDMVMNRSRADTVVLGDSGGYQIASGARNFTFHQQDTVPLILNWLEQIGDWSMGLDFPTGTANSGKIDAHVQRIIDWGIDVPAIAKASGLSRDYWGCLILTKINNNRFLRERRRQTALLNVLQGRTHDESRHWYETMRDYPFEGWAFAAAHNHCPSMIVARLLDMHRDGLLDRCKWLHVLGTAELEMGCYLTAIQREVRALGYPEFQISYDASTATTLAANGQIITGYSVSKHGWKLQEVKVSELLEQHDPSVPLWQVFKADADARTNRDERRRGLSMTRAAMSMTLGDLDPKGAGRLSNDPIAAYHNVEALISAHVEVQDALWGRTGKNSDPLYRSAWMRLKLSGIEQLFRQRASTEQIEQWGYDFLDVKPRPFA